MHSRLQIDGIAAAFAFAAPANRAVTGPLPRFAQMIALGYPEMLDPAAELTIRRLAGPEFAVGEVLAALEDLIGSRGPDRSAQFLVTFMQPGEHKRCSPERAARACSLCRARDPVGLQAKCRTSPVFSGCPLTYFPSRRSSSSGRWPSKKGTVLRAAG